MATGYVIEWRGADIENNVLSPIPKGLPIRVQVVTFTTSAATSNAIGADCGVVELWTSANACWKGAASPTATTNDTPITAGVSRWFKPERATTTKIAFIVQS
jgi:hypothetical protein